MDYHMPGKNGIQAAAAIMLGGEPPLPAVIMLSAFAGEQGKNALTMLRESGAHIVLKPSGEVSLDIEKASLPLLLKIKEIGNVQVKIRQMRERVHHIEHKQLLGTLPLGELSGVIVIGASTGGPPLVEHLLSLLEPEWNIAVVVVQHMSPYFTELFAERLNRTTAFAVREAKEGDVLAPGLVLVVPGGFGLGISEASKSTPRSPALFSLVPSISNNPEDEIDRTMQTLALTFGARVFGVLLSGMGSDGTIGLQAIKARGGYAIVQDPETAPLASMPEHAVSAEGLVDAILPVEKIAYEIFRHLTRIEDGGPVA
jgi:two-component system chemotaxis response regulator CheB